MHTESERITGAVWNGVAASVIGPGHQRDKLPNQDRQLVHWLDEGLCLFAVADGAGSCHRSEYGARFAVEAARDAAEEVFGVGMPSDPSDWSRTVKDFAHGCLRYFDRSVSEAITRVPSTDETPDEIRNSFASTLLAVVAAPPHYVYVSVGDCFLVVDRDPGGPRLLVSAAERENSAVTTFLTSAGREQDLRSHMVVDDRIGALALCSDGLIEGMLALRCAANKDQHYIAPPEFRRYFEYFGGAEANRHALVVKLASRDFARTSNDDKTMVLAVRHARPPVTEHAVRHDVTGGRQ